MANSSQSTLRSHGLEIEYVFPLVSFISILLQRQVAFSPVGLEAALSFIYFLSVSGHFQPLGEELAAMDNTDKLAEEGTARGMGSDIDREEPNSMDTIKGTGTKAASGILLEVVVVVGEERLADNDTTDKQGLPMLQDQGYLDS